MKFSNFVSRGWGFDSLFCLKGRVFVHNDCPGRRIFAPFKSCPPGGLSQAGMVLNEIDTCIKKTTESTKQKKMKSKRYIRIE